MALTLFAFGVGERAQRHRQAAQCWLGTADLRPCVADQGMSNAHWNQLQGERSKSYYRPGGAEVVQADPGRALCFAYGAALAPVFRESRGVNPLQSIPGRVSNFKLMFQHHGGAGSS